MESLIPSAAVAPKSLSERLHAVMEDVTYVQKNKVIDGKYSVVTHDQVTSKLRPAMVKHGVLGRPESFETTQNGNRTELTGFYIFESVDDKSDYIAVPMVGYGIDNQDKGPGKALSYAVKMALLKTFMLETGDGEDPDTDQKTEHNTKAEPGAVQKSAQDVKTVLDMALSMCENVDDVIETFTQDENPETISLLLTLDSALGAMVIQDAVGMATTFAKNVSECNRFFKALVPNFDWLKRSNPALHDTLIAQLRGKKTALQKGQE